MAGFAVAEIGARGRVHVAGGTPRDRPRCGPALGAIATAMAFLLQLTPAARAASGGSMNASEILQELRSLRETASVLYVAAHPDDENTRLIAFLAQGRGYRTGYLSLTRGDGGQNLIGTEFRESLGVIRTQELLAARRIDGGEQFFTRANDFGFSKDSRETLRIWNRDEVLADMVRVIRTFRPDVVITRFSPEPGGTHGHHTASAMLAVEAFELAADPNAFPGQAGDLEPWRARRVFWNVFRWGAPAAGEPGDLRLDVGGFNPLLGQSYGEIAARSRTMHKSQGFGTVGSRGTAWEVFRRLAGDPAATDIMDGVDSSWGRVRGGEPVGARVERIITDFEATGPVASVPALLELRKQMAALAADPLVAFKRRQLDRILQAALGLFVETIVRNAEAVPGEALELEHKAIVRAAFPVTWKSIRYPVSGDESAVDLALKPDLVATQNHARTLPGDTPPSQPYWLRAEGTDGMYAVGDPALIGQPESPPAIPVEHLFEVAGQTLVVAGEPVQVIDDPVKGEIRERLVVIPPVTLALADELALVAPGKSREVIVEATAARAGLAGRLKLRVPAGWTATPAGHDFALKSPGERARVSFTVTAPREPGQGTITAAADIGGRSYGNRRIDIAYDHIPRVLLQPPAQASAIALDLQIRGRTVGYLPGAGDLVGECLARMGYAVTTLSGADLTEDRLGQFDAVVLGIRAFNTRTDLIAHLPALFGYAGAGGTVIVQYNTTAELKGFTLAPYPLRLSRERVTDEHSPVALLASGHPALTTPNRITTADFEGWVQERGLYFPDQWDERFTPLLSMHDPDEAPLQGSVLVAKHGEGWFVYTGLSWFRQLPAGVPGAYRLFANLVSLGK